MRQQSESQLIELELYHSLQCNVCRYPVWIVSDCRRGTDVKYFKEKYSGRVKTVRITASDEARGTR